MWAPHLQRHMRRRGMRYPPSTCIHFLLRLHPIFDWPSVTKLPSQGLRQHRRHQRRARPEARRLSPRKRLPVSSSTSTSSEEIHPVDISLSLKAPNSFSQTSPPGPARSPPSKPPSASIQRTSCTPSSPAPACSAPPSSHPTRPLSRRPPPSTPQPTSRLPPTPAPSPSTPSPCTTQPS